MTARSGYTYMLLSIVLVSPVAVLLRLLLPYAGAESILFIRFIFAGACLGLVILFSGPEKFRLEKKNWLVYCIVGMLYTLTLYAFIHAIDRTTIANSSFLQQLAPVWTFVGAHFFLKERATPMLYVSLALAVMGACIIFLGAGSGLSDSVMGNIFGMASGMFFSARIILLRHLGIKEHSSMSLTFWSFITGIVLMAPFALPRLPASIPAQAWLMFTVLGTVCTALPVLFFVKSLKFMKAQNASMGALLLAVTVPALGLLVGEIPNSESITGGIFIVAGIAFSMKAET